MYSVFSRALAAIVFSLAIIPLFSHAENYVIRDAGYERTFELASDEVAVTKGQKRRVVENTSSRTRSVGEKLELVVYETVNGERVGAARSVTEDVYFRVARGVNASQAAKSAGAVLARPTKANAQEWIAVASDSAGALKLAAALKQTDGVEAADVLLARQQTKKLTPNDVLFTNQFHLLHTGQFGGVAGNDVKVTDAWDTYKGTGQYIAIIDDGLQTAHPDLSPNVNTAIDYDINYNDNDPSPDLVGDDHGTACAGIAAARGNNSIGVSGAAPEATLVGLRLISAFASDADEAEALSWSNGIIQITSNSWGPSDDGETLEGPGALTAAALSNSCTTGRGGLGNLHFWAGGNGLDAFDDSNFDGYANSIYTISISALNVQGLQSWYSEPGANHIVCAPSSGTNGANDEVGTWTTDRTGSSGYNDGATSGEPADANYTATFGGTSSATPLAAGVGALVLEANPAIGWRDMQEILFRSATRNHAGDSGWAQNGVGYWFSHKYGGGLINATGAIALASTWTNLGPQMMTTSNQTGLALALPDNDLFGVSSTFTITDEIRVEHVTLEIDIDHQYRGDVIVQLTSPSNTISLLTDTRADPSTAGFSDWKLMTVHNWGEMAAGTWTVQVADGGELDTGTLNALKLTVYGTGPVPSNQPPVLASIGSQNITASNDLAFAVSATDPVDGDPITLVASNLPAGSSFTSTNGNGNFVWTNVNPVGVFNVTFHASDVDGFDSEVVSINVNDGSCFPSNIFTESFDASTSVPAGWTDGGTANDTVASHYQSSPNCRAFGTGDSLVTPAVSGPTQLMFYVDASGGGNGQSASVEYSVDGGGYVLLGNFTVTTSGNTEVFDLTSSPDLSGSDNVTFRFNSTFNTWYLDDVSVDGGCGIATPAPTNTPPVLAAIGNQSVTESNDLAFAVSATLTDADPVTLSVSNLPSGAAFTSTNENGNFVWTNAMPAGIYTSTFYAADNDGITSEVVVITVSAPPPETPPILAAIGNQSVTESNDLAFAVSATPTDADPVTLSVSNLPSGAAFTSTNENGNFVWTNALPVGIYTSTFYAADNDGITSEVVVITVSATPVISTNCGVIISEYVEGSGNSKAIEIYNPGPGSIDLAAENYVLQFYFNGATAAGTTISLTGTVAESDVYIIADDNADAGVLSAADQIDSAGFFSGNDAVVLRSGGVAGQVVDSFGDVGLDAVFGQDVTLRRKTNITTGDTIVDDAFDAADEWDSFAQNTFTDLGVHTNDCAGGGPVDPDSDSDGILDQWELDNFGSLTNANETSDFDMDFVIDLHEYLAGTEPTNILSFLYVSDSTLDPSEDVVITWPGVSGKAYTLTRSTNILDYIYSVIASNIPGVDPLNIYTDTAPADGSAVYRIEVE